MDAGTNIGTVEVISLGIELDDQLSDDGVGMFKGLGTCFLNATTWRACKQSSVLQEKNSSIFGCDAEHAAL